MSERWCIYIDILGFSEFWEDERSKALNSLGCLMSAIHRIGTEVYPNEPERLFVHQMGDGFAIVSDFGEASLERPIAIAIALMRCVATTGVFAAAAIAEGDFADISGCYPEEVRDSSNDEVVKLGDGLMTLSSVMGTAFIRAHHLGKAAPSGPFLTVSKCNRGRVPDGLPVRETKSKKGIPLLSIDWIRSESPLLTDILKNADIKSLSPDEIIRRIQEYCEQYPHIREKWGRPRPRREILDIDIG